LLFYINLVGLETRVSSLFETPRWEFLVLATSQERICILLIARLTSLKFPRQTVSLRNVTPCKYFRT